MPSQHRLDLTGYRGEKVPNTFLRQDATATRVAIFFPGFGYSCDMPLFYYATLLLLDMGADVLRVEYAYQHQPGFRELPSTEQDDWLLADATTALEAVSQQSQFEQIIVIGKSLGTRAMGHLLTAKPHSQDMRAVWLTPLLRDRRLRQQMRQAGVRSLYVIGTADPHYDPDHLRAITTDPGKQSITIEGGDHSLDVAGDVVGSLRAMELVITALEAFLAG